MRRTASKTTDKATIRGEIFGVDLVARGDGDPHIMMNFLIEDHFTEPGLNLQNRILFAMAAYNCGPGNVARCRTLATKMGYDPNLWFNNVEVATAKIIGRETTQYVANIYKYYVAYRLAGGTYQRRQEAARKTVKK